MYIEAGMHVIGGASFLFNQKERPFKLHRERDYPELLSMAAAHPVAFYDVEDHRVWLVDGASALLHLTRISLHMDATDQESPYDWVFDKTQLDDKWTGRCGRVAAIETLKCWKHREAPIYVKKRCIRDGQTVLQFATLEDRVNQILEWLEVIIDRDKYLASESGIKIRQTLDQHKCTTGFDILDLLKPLGPVGTRSAPMSRSGHGWADMLPVIGATTIFGAGFGELIRPNDLTQTCSEWSSLPVGFDLMAVTTSTLKMIYDKRLRRNNPDLDQGELTCNLLWKSSKFPFTCCGCVATNAVSKGKHTDPVQFLFPKSSRLSLRNDTTVTPVDIPGLSPNGALIFSNTGYGNRNGKKADILAAQATTHLTPSGPPSGRPSGSSSASTSASNTTQSGGSTNRLTANSSHATSSSANVDNTSTARVPSASTDIVNPNNVPSVTVSAATPPVTADTSPPVMNTAVADAAGSTKGAATGTQMDQQDPDAAHNSKKRKKESGRFERLVKRTKAFGSGSAGS
jgi:hypothetical protein